MEKNTEFHRISVWIGLCAFFISLGVPSLVAAETPVVSQSEMVQHSIKDRVRSLRQQRFQQMPYLDKGFVRSAIKADQVRQRDLFLAAGKKDLQLLVGRAIEVHTPIRAARERMALANRRILVAFRNLFPEAEFQFEEQDGDLSAQPFNSRSYRFNLAQPIFRGGILWNTLLQEKVELQVAKKEFDAAIGELINEVSIAYFEYNRAVQVARERAAVADDIKRYADISNQKFQAEIISEIEHLNVQSLASEVEYDYETAKQEIELAKLDLQKYLNLNGHDDIEISPLYDVEQLLLQGEAAEISTGGIDDYSSAEGLNSDFEGTVEIPNLSELVDLAYLNRPELQVEAAKLESARLEERVRWGELLPQADFILEFGKLGEALDNVSVNPSLRKEVRVGFEVNWNAMGSNVNYQFDNTENAPSATQFQAGTGSQTTTNTISVGIFDGLEDFAEAKDAEVAKLEQIVALEEAEKEVMVEVKQAYYDLQKSKIQVQSRLQRVNYRKRLVSLAEHRLGKNEIQISEYLQGHIDLQQELGQLHRALADYFSAKTRLNHAIGIKDYFAIEESHVS